jgi:hypothetical protein
VRLELLQALAPDWSDYRARPAIALQVK